MGKKLLKARAWLIMEAEVLFGGSIWKSTPPSMCWKSWVVSSTKAGRGQAFRCLPRNGPSGKVSPIIIKVLLTRGRTLPCTFRSSE